MFIKLVLSIPGHPFESPNWYTGQSSLFFFFSNPEPSFLRGFQNKLMTDAVLAGQFQVPWSSEINSKHIDVSYNTKHK